MPKAVDDDLEGGPPSSVNVARALASLRGDELRRLDALMRADDEPASEEVAVAPKEPPPPSRPTIKIGPSIVVAELAKRMATTADELIMALVTRGFFSIHAKSALPRETAREIAASLGWNVEDDPEAVAEEPAPARAARSRARATKKTNKKSASSKTKRSGSRR